MPRHRPATPEQAREREEDRQRKLAALRVRLHSDAQALRTPGDWARCLLLAARLPGENFANILLISSQRPGATLVRDYRQWHAMGRQVRRREKGIEIFSVPPRPQRGKRQGEEQDEQGQTWRDADRVAHVWDLSQTTGPVIPVRATMAPGQAATGLWDSLCWLARREGFGIEREHGAPADGVTFWAARRIRVLPDLSGRRAVWALAHQLGHVLLHNTPSYPPGTTTSGCAGVRKAEADSVAFIVCARHGIAAGNDLSYPASWAGTDPRAQPGATILAAGQRITTAAARITRHTDRILGGETPSAASAGQEPTTLTRRDDAGQHDPATIQGRAPLTQPAAAGPPPEQAGSTRRVLADAGKFYTGHFTGSWAPAYLLTRGISDAVSRDWHIGYAPAGWTALTDHLRGLGHDDDAIEAAGLARRSSRGTLIDHFRDRVVLPVIDFRGTLVGFIGRAHPRASPDVPKYLNSPETAVYKKGDLLFGLHHGRRHLAQGATPVLVEGPFDAIAVTIADPDRYVGLAPCGTALTSRQALVLSQAADLSRTGILVAFDGDAAGRKAAVRAHGILSPVTAKLQSTLLDGKDPAEILQQDGPTALRTTLREHIQPLSALVIDSSIEPWGRRLRDLDGPYLAMLSAASLIADLLPADSAGQIRRITGDRKFRIVDDLLRRVSNPELTQIARVLPAETAYQIVRVAGKLDFDCSDVLAEVANATTRSDRSPKGTHRPLRDDPDRSHAAFQLTAARLASSNFPHLPLSPHATLDCAASRPTAPTNRQRPICGGRASSPMRM